MMRSDKELLELAAKAAGVIGEYRSYYVEAYNKDFFGIAVKGASSYNFWNPLTDDGDALRLAVKLNIQVTPRTDDKSEAAHTALFIEQNNGDPYAATRRAITRAAAEIGATL